MRVVSWNMKGVTEYKTAWKILAVLDPDVALLQEVTGIPSKIEKIFDEIRFRKAVNKHGYPQKFGTAIFVKGKIIGDLPLISEYDWVNKELEHFAGNLVSCVAQPTGYPELNLVSVYSPAWPINTSEYPSNVDISTIKISEDPKLWVTEILWAALKNANLTDIPWIVGGDLNCSETFNTNIGIGDTERLKRMTDLGFTECLRKYNGRLTPTFKNPIGGKVKHQMDHVFVNFPFSAKLKKCIVGNASIVFGKPLISDHLPIIADFS